MNRKSYWSVLCVILIAALSACGGGNSTPPPPPVETIVATSGSGRSAVISTAFAAPLVATVSTGGTPNSGVTVTFTAPSAGASGTFGSGSATATATTDSERRCDISHVYGKRDCGRPIHRRSNSIRSNLNGKFQPDEHYDTVQSVFVLCFGTGTRIVRFLRAGGIRDDRRQRERPRRRTRLQ